MPSSTDYNDNYRKQQANITRKAWQSGVYNFKIRPLETRSCKSCKILFQVKPSDPKIFCNHSCSAKVNNSLRKHKESKCISCGKTTKRYGYTYCSNSCHAHYQYQDYIKRWQDGLENGIKGITIKIVSGHIRHYLKEKYGPQCSICNWNKIHPITGHVPLEIDHIDGNAENNSENNLRLICPNCHALTPNFRNLNKGHGRAWRSEKLKQATLH